jgi:ribosomal protein S12 methylthiotransferase accessory factor
MAAERTDRTEPVLTADETVRLRPAAELRARLIAPEPQTAPAPGPDAAALFEGIRSALPALGITRVGDLTGLDVIGIPVWFATRPNARALSVSQGKGLTHEQARLSATMEAIEGAVSERPETVVTRQESWGAMRRLGLAMPMARQMRCLRPEFPDGRVQAWVPGLSLRSGKPVFAPYELIGLDFRSDRDGAPRWDRQSFRMTSIGLGAGGDLAQATLQALLELVENAATAPLHIFGLLPSLARPLRYRRGTHPGLDAAMDRIAAAGLEARFVDLTDRSGLPVIGAFVERTILDDTAGDGTRACAGFACRLDANEAALAAVLEAAQSRLTDIAGARDDIEPADYAAHALSLPRPTAGTPEIGEIGRGPAPRSREAALRAAVDAVLAGGAPDVMLFPLAPPPLEGATAEIHVARVLVPGLEAAAADGVMQLGASTLDRLLQSGGLPL